MPRKTPRSLEEIESNEQLEKELKEKGPSTALNAMFKQLGNYPMLSREEQRAAFERHDEDALLGSMMRMVIMIAKKHTRPGIEMEDLIQEGSMGALNAIRKFDPNRGGRFSTYCHIAITRYCRKYVTSKSRIIQLPEQYVAKKLHEYYGDENDEEN